jgi:hypothetical protein
MFDTDHVFSNIHTRKAPVITYKRRQHTVSSLQRLPIISPDSTTVQKASFFNETASIEQQTVSVPEPTISDDKNGRIQHKQQISVGRSPMDPALLQTTRLPMLDIFDFPDEDNNDTEVELRIASSLHSNNKVSCKRTYGRPAKSTKGRTAVSTSAKISTTKPTTSSRTMTEPLRIQVMTGTDFSGDSDKKSTEVSIWDIPADSTYSKKTIKPATSKSSLVPFNRTLSAPAQTTTFLSSPPPLGRTMSSIPCEVKKRKRNVVSRLKAANGERLDSCSQPVGDRFYNMASDTDDDDSTTQRPMPTDHLSTTPSLPTPSSSDSYVLTPTASSSPSNVYNDHMEQELADLMRTEFGQPDDHRSSSSPPPPSSSTSSSTVSSLSSHRPCYVPENAIRAPVTYKRFHTKPSSSTPHDADLEQQIQYLLS